MSENEQPQQKEKKATRIRKIRLIPIWARLLIVIFIMCVSLIAGLMVGYGVIGDGKATDALSRSTWTKVIDLVVKDAPSE